MSVLNKRNFYKNLLLIFNRYNKSISSSTKNIFKRKNFNRKLSVRNKIKGKTNHLISVFSKNVTAEDLIEEKKHKFFNRKYFSKYYLPTKNRHKVEIYFFQKWLEESFLIYQNEWNLVLLSINFRRVSEFMFYLSEII